MDDGEENLRGGDIAGMRCLRIQRSGIPTSSRFPLVTSMSGIIDAIEEVSS